MARFSRISIVVILVYLSCERCRSCNYTIEDLSNVIEIDNNLDPNDTIFTFTLLDTQDNNRTVTGQLLIPDQTQTDTNEYFTTITTGNFYITGLALGNNCPPPNTSETFYLTLRSDFTCKYTVHVEVSAAIPEFDIMPQVEILIDNQTQDPFTVIQFKLNNQRQCAQFNCSVKVRNSNKAFTIEAGSLEVKTTLEYIRFDFTYVLDVICFIPDSAISDEHTTMVRIIFRTNITDTSPLLRVGSTDSTYEVTDSHLHLIDGASTSLSALPRTALSALARTALSSVSKTALTAIHRTIFLTAPRSTLSTESRTALSAAPRTALSAASRTAIPAALGTTVSAVPRTVLSAALRIALSTATRTPFSSTPPRNALSPNTAISFVLTPLISRKVSVGIYSKSFSPTSALSLRAAHSLFDTPSKMAAVCTGAGLVGLGATGVLIYHASRRCRSPRIRSHAGSNDKQVPENSQDVR